MRNGPVGYNSLFETNRLILRECTPNDLEIFEEIFGDEEKSGLKRDDHQEPSIDASTG